MPNHPNRGAPRAGSNPHPEDIRAFRLKHGLTVCQAGALVYCTGRMWQRWEEGETRCHPAFWELANLKAYSGGNLQ